jgi:thiamine biosynthesis lipoprotein
MGTVITQSVFGVSAGPAQQDANREIARLEALLSRFQADSEVSQINRLAGAGTVCLSPDTLCVLELAVEYSLRCSGFFDVTIGPLVRLWQQCKAERQAPPGAAIDAARALVAHGDLIIEFAAGAAGLRRRGQSIDLGGIGKGYAGDRLLAIYREHDVTSAVINLGGNVVTIGSKPDGSPWRVGVRHPRREDAVLGLVSVTDKAVVTSGDYQRFFVDRDGRRHHHILDPRTGYPADAGLSSVTIVAASSTVADVLSTAVFVAGLEIGSSIIGSCPGVEAILVDTRSRVFLTPGLRGCFEAARDIDVSFVQERRFSNDQASA